MDRFWEKVHVGSHDDCWLWTAQTNATGYGIIKIGRSPKMATHVALELAGRPRIRDALALHSCDNPSCVNPRHLRWGTRKENTADMDARNRRGRGYRRKPYVSDEVVTAIAKATAPQRQIASQFGVSLGLVNKIRNGKPPYENAQ